MARHENLHDLYQHELSSLIAIERRMTDRIPALIGRVSEPQLKEALSRKYDGSRANLDRLEAMLDQKDHRTGTDRIVDMLLEEVDLVSEQSTAAVVDAALIVQLQKLEHHEIAIYGSLRTFAIQMGENETANYFQRVLDEEKTLDNELNQVAEHAVNLQATGGTR